MSQFFSTRYLKYTRLGARRTIRVDEPCRGCGYNLRGLAYGGACPECGAPIDVPDPVRDSIIDAPRPELIRLRRGLGLALIVMPSILIAAPVTSGLSVMGWWVGPVIMLAVGAAWGVAVWMLTPVMSAPGGVRRGFSRRSPMRLAARWLPLGLPLSQGLLVVTMRTTTMPQPMLVAIIVLSAAMALAGVIGIVLLAVLLARLAEWSSNDAAMRLFDWAAWGLITCSGLLVLGLLNAFLRLLACLWTVLWLASLACFFFALLEMMRTVHWSLRHARERDERGREMRKKMGGRAPGRLSD